MKTLRSVIALVGVAIAFSGQHIFAKSNANNSSGSSFSGGHHTSSSSSTPATTSMPRYGGTSRFSGGTSYQPRINFSNGNRTLNYPAVRNSIIRQQLYSNRSNISAGNRFQRDTNSVLRRRSSTMTGLNSGYALQHSENLRQSSNLTQGARLNAATIHGGNKLDPQTKSRLRHWDGNVSSTQQAHGNHLSNCQHHHDHWWWRHHCAAIIFFDFGWWGWYDGWWYPAWGYDPYSYYDYNEPIYGYDGLSPEQVVASVQVALQERGYYQYAVDGRMGPLTRAAIARFQSDRRLPITSGIDPATLGSLGIIR